MKNVKGGHEVPVVCLDAGHYGKYNRSPAVKEYFESDMNWKLHLLLKKELECYGIRVKTTRSNQSADLDLRARGMASLGCDLFLSLHSNAVGSSVNDAVDYVAVYHLTTDAGTDADDRSRELAKLLAPAIASTMGVKQGSKVLTRKAATDKNGDGVLNDNYYGVLNGARLVDTPGLILEHSFHTNTRSTKWLMEAKNLQKLAKAEAAVIAKWFDVKKPVASKNATCTVALPVLRFGAKGDAVGAMQALLVAKGYSLGNYGKQRNGIDEHFGVSTENAVEAFQEDTKLAVDGVCGAATWAELLGV